MNKLRIFLIATMATVLMACGGDKEESVAETPAAAESSQSATTAEKAAKLPASCETLVEKSEKMRATMTEKSKELIAVMPEEQREAAETELNRQLATYTINDAKAELFKDIAERGEAVVAEECVVVIDQLDEIQSQLLEAMEAQKAMFIEMQKAGEAAE